MKLIVGLGNPGPKYEQTRHNVGFLCIDYLADQWRAQGPLVKNQAEYWQCTIEGEQVLLIKPQTFMNLSGRAVAPFYQFYKCTPSDVIVSDWVLGKIPNSDWDGLPDLFDKAEQGIRLVLKDDLKKAMALFHRKTP